MLKVIQNIIDFFKSKSKSPIRDGKITKPCIKPCYIQSSNPQTKPKRKYIRKPKNGLNNSDKQGTSIDIGS